VRTAAAALLLALAPVAPAAAGDAPVAVYARVEPDTVTIGQRFRYTLEVTSAPDVELMLSQPTEMLGDFTIVDFGDLPPARKDGTAVVTRWFTLVGYAAGEHWLTSPPVRYRLPGEGMADAPEAGVRVSVESVLAKAPDATDIRDVKPIEPVPVDWRPAMILGGALLGILALGAALYRLLNRPRRGLIAPPPRPAHEVARNALERLRRRRLVETGAFKEYYSALTDIVRAYLEHRFQVRAPEMTTEEFLLASARGGRLAATHRALLGEFLRESDLVKFARHHPAITDAERAWTAARRFVDETAPAAPEDVRAAG